MLNTPDYYEALHISPKAEFEIIQVAYKRLVEKWQAERRSGDTAAFDRLSLYDAAYGVLSNPTARQAYDKQREEAATREEPHDPAVRAKLDESGVNTSSKNDSPICPFAMAMLILGVILFLMGLQLDALIVVARCAVWGLIFGIPMVLCNVPGRRTGMTCVTTLFCFAAALDVAVDAVIPGVQTNRL